MPGIQEFLIIIIIIVVLSWTGLWPVVIRALRELRGDYVQEPPRQSRSAQDTDMCYRILGLSPSARWEEIEKAYRAKAKRHHPDLGGDEDTMRAVNEAYNRIKELKKPR
ncbi:MAG: J domain-containing protein [Candidatus Hydrogenedentes bacterium]|jgi:DnaJ-domain-containing protein 1|nr:J domain-containing protein [Candidatus Hydrogenedentota bacterium]